MLLQVCVKHCNMGAKVKPDHGQYLAMIELQKTENLIRMPLYELIRVLLLIGAFDCVHNSCNNITVQKLSI